MTKLINYIRDVPERTIQRQQELRRFLQKIDETLSFAPDRQFAKNSSQTTEQSGQEPFWKQAALIEEALEKEFFSNLYIERNEKEEIEGYLPTKRLLLLHGLMGTGKTVLLMKVASEINEEKSFFIEYIDCKAIVEQFNITSEQDFIARFRTIVYHRLQAKLVDPYTERIKNWLIYRVENDVDYLSLKEAMIDFAQRPISGNDWLEILNQPIFKEKRLSLTPTNNLVVLLKYIRNIIPLVLCFDNVDGFSLQEQGELLESCINISNEAEIPIILAIRTTNIRRINTTGAMGDFVYFVKLEPLQHHETDDDDLLEGPEVWGKERVTPGASIQSLLEKRVTFIRRHEAFTELGEYFKSLLKKFNLNTSISDSINNFWRVFRQIIKSFVKNDVYSFCNYNIRATLVFYFDFINSMLLNPEPDYSAKELLSPRYGKVDITKLRNYLYKWLICEDEIVPDKKINKNINIFTIIDGEMPMLTLKVLAYLSNNRDTSEGVVFKQMLEDFWRIGINRGRLLNAVQSLAQNQEFNEKCFIWIDKAPNGFLSESSRIFLMPAGQYFIEHLSVSREYVFWMALTTDLSPTGKISNVYELEHFNYSDTTNDKFKLDIAYKFLERVVIPKLSSEISYYNKKLYLPDDWKKSNLRYFLNEFGISGQLYQHRLVNSILNSILFADLDPNDAKSFTDKYTKLLSTIVGYEKSTH
jgi:hypothetical protein